MKKVTLKEVAERSGVSLATASKVMNGRPDVNHDTGKRVLAAAADIGYAPKKREPVRAHSLVIVFDSLAVPYSLSVLDGAVRAARRAGVGLEVVSSVDLAPGETEVLSRQWFQQMADRGHGGAIVVTSAIDGRHKTWSRAAGMPLIAVDPESASGVDGVRISATNWSGGQQAVEHLLELGHTRIGVVAGPERSVSGRDRIQGYRSALQQAGIPYDPALVRGERYSYEEGRRVGFELLEMEDPPTAIFAVSDSIAVGVLRAAHELGLHVPRDLSVIGFDDTVLATSSSPLLTVIRQPLQAMGQLAVERTLALAADPDLFSHPVQLETELVIRESTGPAPDREN
ncbi:MAG: substrate-binding domain-containing protein [Brachybacterium sp.]|nr:substrate-binding domain-containing protein [Brachybacterium sp.]